MDPVGELHHLAVAAEPQRRRSSLVTTSTAIAVAEIAAHPGIGPGRTVRSLGSCSDLLADLAPGAVVLVDQVEFGEATDGVVVETEPLALADHLAVPVEPDRGQIGELGLLQRRIGLLA